MPSSVSWRYDHTTEPWLRWCLLAGVAVLFGAYLGMLLTAAVSLALVLVVGGPGVWLLVLLLALVGGPLSLLYLLPMIRDPDQRPTIYPGGSDRPPVTRERVAAVVVGAVVLGAAFRVEPLLAGGLFVAGALAGLVALLCSTRGRIDPETGTVETGEREWDLSRVTGYSVRRVGPLAVVALDASGPGRFGTVPSRIAVPTTALDRTTAALDRVVAETDGTSGREPNTIVRIVAVGLAVLFAGGGLAAATLAGPVGWYAAAVGLVLAGGFLLVAREG